MKTVDGLAAPVGEARTPHHVPRLPRVGFVLMCLTGAVLAGRLLAQLTASRLHSKMLPWILGRGLGLAAFVSLGALTVLGLWVHHPWRLSTKGIKPITLLRVHSDMAATTVTLVIAHLTALALDPYAHVGWVGALVPWQSPYRPGPVALGTLALWMLVLVGVTAGLAGVIGGGRWLLVHRLGWTSFAAALLHGVTAGSDALRLRMIYLIAGILVGSVAITRAWAQLRQRAGAVA